jgi:hypothetical protein
MSNAHARQLVLKHTNTIPKTTLTKSHKTRQDKTTPTHNRTRLTQRKSCLSKHLTIICRTNDILSQAHCRRITCTAPLLMRTSDDTHHLKRRHRVKKYRQQQHISATKHTTSPTSSQRNTSATTPRPRIRRQHHPLIPITSTV